MRSRKWKTEESHFIGDAEAICRANVFLRTAERILIEGGEL